METAPHFAILQEEREVRERGILALASVSTAG